MPRIANISGRSRRLSLSRKRQSTTSAMKSDGYWVRFSRVPERSLNCLPHARQRNQEHIVEIERNRAQVCLGNIKVSPQFEAGISDLVADQLLPIEDLISGLA